ncbi:MAG TPA: endolytic transglycosylase MltG [bacterium]|nr:endolytic transglycosylase MltG [bacterium]
MRWSLFIVLAAVAAMVVVAVMAVLPVDPNGEPRLVFIPSGSSSADIGHRLERAGVIGRALDFVILVRLRGLTRSLQDGEYRLSPAMGLLDIVDRIARGAVVHYPVTIPEGYTARQIVEELVQTRLGDRDEFLRLVRTGAKGYDLEFLGALTGTSLEGYLFPDTYQIPRHLEERAALRLFLDRFGELVLPRWRESGRGRPLHEIVTVASMVEREARVPAERPLIAGVIYNRLARGWKLEVDATVLYALGQHKPIVTFADLKVDSPYNTYLHPGLPPGPIANPGLAAIDAALNPTKTDYLYYVARADGSHVFSRTLGEHEAAVRRYRGR